ncbi:MAG: aminoacetone oxidase family FAD-binding enzyme, partial [Phyllobacteriaceae bacterium]|nr:aminoacetone oxidase family FAD-binding enzyme [Phyllobacteriaceae bacterium]
RFEGEPLKRVALRFDGLVALGEAMITRDGLEGGATYALSGPLRDAIAVNGPVTVEVDLKPGLAVEEIAAALSKARKGDSQSNVLRKAAGLPPVAIGILREGAGVGGRLPTAPDELARLIKAVPLQVIAARPIERAISSAGGIRFDEVDDRFMLKKLPGVFVCGEMLDWEAPTGGYLLQACFSTGRAAGEGAARWLARGGQAPVTA